MKKISKTITLVLFIAAVVFAAGCAEKTVTPVKENVTPGDKTVPPVNETVPPVNETVPPVNETVTPAKETITPGNVATEKGLVVTASDSGKTIKLNNGETFTLDLRENPSTGYAYELNLTDGLKILSDKYTQDEAPPGKAGVPGTRSLKIQTTSPGTQQVNGIYKRSWENTTGTEEKFTLTVEVA